MQDDKGLIDRSPPAPQCPDDFTLVDFVKIRAWLRDHVNNNKQESISLDMICHPLKPVCEAASALYTVSIVYKHVLSRHLRWIES